MFSNLINGRKGSGGDRTNHRLSGSSPQPVTADRIRHPQHVYAQQEGPASPSYESSRDGSSYMSRQDSAGSTSASAPGWNSPGGTSQYSRSPAQLPEEMRARERQKQAERDRERRERQSSQSSVQQAAAASPSPAPATTAQDSPAKYSSSHMESSVTRLLVATKMLLESLTKWSVGQRTEEDVSDIYVRLGNDFNSAKLAFGSYGIDMSDLNSVPDDLRDCLERCLSEEASPAVLEVHLPRIREIIINLLQGLKMKQAEYKQFLVQQRAAKEAKRSSILPEASYASTPPPPQQQQQQQPKAASNRVLGPRASRQGFSESAAHTVTEEQSAAASTANASQRPDSLQRAGSAGAALQTDRAVDDADSSTTPPASAPANRGSVVRPPSRVSRTASDRTTSKRASELPSPALPSSTFSSADASESESGQATPRMQSLERHTLTDNATAASSDDEQSADQPGPLTSVTPQRLSTRSPRHTPKSSIDANSDFTEHDPSLKALKNRDALERRASKRFSAYTFNKMGVGQSYTQGMGINMFPSSGSAAGSPLAERKTTERRGSGARRVVRPPLPEASPALEGAASPSTFARTADYFGSSNSSNSISSARPMPRSRSTATVDSKFESIEEVKTPTSSTFARDGRTPSPEPSSMTSEEPASSSAATAAATAAAAAAAAASPARKQSRDLLAPVAPGQRVTSQAVSSTESLPFLDAQAAPSSDLGDPAEAQTKHVSVADAAVDTLVPATPRIRSGSATTSSINIFLQLGRQTRKAAIELDASNPLTRGISVARLRMLFIDRFAYSPGMDDFPTIYLKDPSSGVTYELEDLNDVQDGSLLTLNIEPLDQVKQHLDLSLGTISREIRELKAALAERDRDVRRMSLVNSDTLLTAHATPTKISDSQFQAAGQRVAQLKRANTRAAGADNEASSAQDAGSGGVAAASSSALAGGSRIAHELKVQFDELQNLRREFAITRQLQTDFEGDIKSILATVREQSGSVRAIASTKVAAERNFIVAGKARLDNQSQDLLTLIEDLQDTVDDLRVDVIQRGVKPRPVLVKQIVDDVDRATKGLLELEGYVQTVKPSWKKTWESELQNIVDEQEFLNHEEGLLSDLRDDLGALKEVFSNIQQVVKLRGGSGKGGKYIPPLPEEGHEGLSTVMMEVKSQAVNHEKRLRALQAVERQRQKDLLASKTNDEFSEELAGFVDKKVLRKTGGVLEAERIRQKRDHATWKAMFGGGGPGGVPMTPSGSGGVEVKPKKLILGGKKAKDAAVAASAANASTVTADDDTTL
ncbi:related to actin-interacting protein AIP3 [Sporisorium reilianum f. sp. reilianum]|uniref:Related to actin-interacting protein AIP3 n=1 Tax=Sporisorium reilianum f. sp. reilianum TaxID=72559 RepID=A0A2N8UA10_9BASI|nr:related to actin-interacting protein AIP3 [Sporisorium reilianum f. sp. reilianum]